MPDWTIHILFATPLARFFKKCDLRWLITGAVLPDFITMLSYATMDTLDIGKYIDPIIAHIYLHMFHTPVMVLLMICIGAVFFKNTKIVLISAIPGAISHFLLDTLQRHAGGGTAYFFPFLNKNYTFDILWYEELVIPLCIISAILCSLYIFLYKGRYPFIIVPLSIHKNKKLILLLILIPLFLILPAVTYKSAIAHNVNSINFIQNTEAYENKKVGLPVSKILKTGPILHIVESDKIFQVINNTGKTFQTGTFVSVEGTYKFPYIYPDFIFVHNYTIKIILSIIGLTFLIVVWLFPIFFKHSLK
jgi:hypothetical protein